MPGGAVLHDRAEAARLSPALTLPRILKPLQGSGGGGIAEVHQPGDWSAALAAAEFPCLAQRFVRGRAGVCDLLCRRGELLAWTASYKLRTKGPRGPSIARRFHAQPRLEALARKVAADTGFDGFSGFDWMEEEGTGRHWLIEFHPRLTSGWRFAGALGLDLPAALRAWLDGTRLPGAPVTYRGAQPRDGLYFTADLLGALRRRDWAALRQWLPGSGAGRDLYPLDAPHLFAAWLGSRRRT